jgi:putative phosphoesterase
MKLGVISDTHGHLDQQIHSIFEGVDEIIHAGDIGNDDVLIELQTLAPVTAVRGNMDRFGRPATYQEFLTCTFEGRRFFLVHDLGSPHAIKKHLLLPIQRYAPHVIIFGHTHRPYLASFMDVLYFNPGSASQARGGKNRSVGIIEILNSTATGKIFPLEDESYPQKFLHTEGKT